MTIALELLGGVVLASALIAFARWRRAEDRIFAMVPSTLAGAAATCRSGTRCSASGSTCSSRGSSWASPCFGDGARDDGQADHQARLQARLSPS